MVLHDIGYSDQFETYYNICWFDSDCRQRS